MKIDTLFSAVLTFGLLIAGTAAIGSEMLKSRDTVAEATRVVMLPAVEIVGHRLSGNEVVMLPAVTITGHRASYDVAYEPRAAQQ